MNSNQPGMQILSLIPGSPAVKAGIKPGDRLIAVDGKPVNGPADYIAATEEWKETHTYDIMRGSRFLTLTATMEKRTDEPVNYHEIVSLLERDKNDCNRS